MKKIFAAVLILLLLAFGALYWLLPVTYHMQEAVRLQVNQKALHRTLQQQSLGGADSSGRGDGFHQAVQLHASMFDGFVLRVTQDSLADDGQLRLIALSEDSTLVYWSAVAKGGSSPWQRWQTWRKSRELAGTVRNYLSELSRFERIETVYGFKPVFAKVRDSVMVTTRFTTQQYPTTRDIYRHVDMLQQYISVQGAEATNHPMLFVQPTSKGYEAQVAVPTNKLLPGTGEIDYRRMVKGNILEAEVTGGQAKVEASLQQLGYFVVDQDLISPAIPFALLVTDRTKEPDSTKWVTRIYYPIY